MQLQLNDYIILSTLLFVIGVVGVLVKRNALIIFMSIEVMLNAVNLLLVAFSVFHNDTGGQVFVVFIMIVAAAEVSVGLAILVQTFRINKSIDVNVMNKLKW